MSEPGSPSGPVLDGITEPGWEPVRDAFVSNFAERGEVGASVCVYHRGVPVVDLAGGTRTQGGHEPYDRRTLQLVFSSTKGATAVCAHLLAERGQLDLDAPVADYWPEFVQAGKETITVRWLLSHKAGLADVDRSLTLDDALDWEQVTEALAASAPLWEPGTKHGYHAVTFGWLVGEVVRRVSGRSLGTFFADEVAGPLGLDFWIGLPADQLDRVAPLIPMTPPPGMELPGADGPGGQGNPDGGGSANAFRDFLAAMFGPDNLIGRALSAPGGALGDQDVWNDPRVLAAEIPAANGVTNAQGLARMYAATVGEVDGVRLLTHETAAAAAESQTDGPDAVLMIPMSFGSGFMRPTAFTPFTTDSAFGHYGAGGSVGFADPAHELGFGYAMNKMDLGITGDVRTITLIGAVNECLAALG